MNHPGLGGLLACALYGPAQEVDQRPGGGSVLLGHQREQPGRRPSRPKRTQELCTCDQPGSSTDQALFLAHAQLHRWATRTARGAELHSACEREAVIYVTDLRAMVAFYAQGLGFTATDVQDSHAVLAADAWTLQLVRVPAEVAAAIRVTRPPRRRSGVPVKLAFPVADIDALGSELERLGGRLDPDETRRGFGDRLRRDAVEPEGNVIQLLAPGQEGGASQWRWERRLAQRFGFADPTSSRRTR